MTVKRIWHGYTTPERADEYEALLKAEVIKGIEAKAIPGFRKIEVLRRPLGDEIEFVTIMDFDTLDSVKAFVGEDYEQAYVPAEAQALLSSFDRRSQHYEVEEVRAYGPLPVVTEEPEMESTVTETELAPAGEDEDEVAKAAFAAEFEAASTEEHRYDNAPVIDAVPVVEPAEESLVSEEPVIAPPEEPATEALAESQPILADDKWFVRKDRGRGAVPATRQGYKVVANFIFGMVGWAVAAAVMLVVGLYSGPPWLTIAAPVVFAVGALLTAIYFIGNASRHTDKSITFSEYRRLAREEKARAQA